MKRIACLLGVIIPLLFIQAGCWDIKSIQDTNYITAFGLDYKDGKYVAYAQLLDFSSVAKQEGGGKGKPATVWTGRQEGETGVEAIDNLLKTSQQRVFFGHISAMVFTENALKQGLRSYLEGLIRFRESRYTQWVYGTREPLDRLFATTPFFNLSPLASILHQPKDSYEQRSFICPFRLYKVVATLREPGSTLVIPSLDVATDAWKRNDSPDPKLEVDGIFAIQGGKMISWMDEKQLAGLRWLEKKTVQTSVVLRQEGKPAATVTVGKLKWKIIPHASGQSASFSVQLKCKAMLNELVQQMDEALVKRETAKEIRSELERTFAYGRKTSADLYGLEHVLYHDAFPDWSRLTMNGSKPLKEYSIDSIQIEVELLHTGMFKMREEQQQY